MARYRTTAAQPAATTTRKRQPIYAPGSTGGTYPSAQMPDLDLAASAVGLPGGGGRWNTYGGGQGQQQYFTDPNRQVGYAGGSGSWTNTAYNQSRATPPPGYSQIPGQSPQEIPGGGTSSTAGQPSFYSQLFGSYQDAWNRAAATNEARYGDILGGHRDRYGTGMELAESRYGAAMGLVGQLGQAERAEVNRIYDAREGQMMQDLASKGLATGSLAWGVGQGVDRERSRRMQEVEEGLTREKLAQHGALSGDLLSTHMQGAGDTLGFMERRTDEYPSLTDMYNMAIKLGEMESGRGGGGSGVQFASPSSYGYQVPGQAWGMGGANTGYQLQGGGRQGYGYGDLQAATRSLNAAGQNPQEWRRLIEQGTDPRMVRQFHQLPAETQRTMLAYYYQTGAGRG